MAKRFSLKTFFPPLLIITLAFVCYLYIVTMPSSQKPGKPQHHHLIPQHISEESMTPVNGTRHFMVGAYMEHRIDGYSLRIISIFRQDSIQPLYCVFYCGSHWANGTKASVQIHPEFYAVGFPFVATDVLCQSPPGCNESHVTLSTEDNSKLSENHMFLRIRNLEEERIIQFNFTVCVSNLFGGYNNVLQITQTLEMYRLLGVQHVVMYNTSCGPDLEKLLQSYMKEGFVEVVPWPIDQYMEPSSGWLFGEHGGDIHYYGQLATLNDCLYRQMYLSRYILLNDIDEIITPYQHEALPQLMDELQRQHPKASGFMVENHFFSVAKFDPSGQFEHLWENIPGRNIMEHIYRQEPSNYIDGTKLIVQPRSVIKTSVHSVLNSFEKMVRLPPHLVRIIHVRAPQSAVTKEKLHEDKRIWDYAKKLILNVNKALERAGLLI